MDIIILAIYPIADALHIEIKSNPQKTIHISTTYKSIIETVKRISLAVPMVSLLQLLLLLLLFPMLLLGHPFHPATGGETVSRGGGLSLGKEK
jgi:hypothetical protein